MTKLTDLEATFLRYELRDGKEYHIHVNTIKEAQGVRFLCPLCFKINNGPIGTHIVVCWNRSVPQAISPGPGRWKLDGTGLHDLTLNNDGPRSIQLTSGCKWHGFINNGDAS